MSPPACAGPPGTLGALSTAFPTPVWAADLGDAVDNVALLAAIEAVKTADRDFRFWRYPKGYTSFYGGLRLWDNPAFAPLITAIFAASRAYLESVGARPDKPKRLVLTDLFCTIGRKHSSHRRHNHGEVEVSGVYYVAAPKNSANLTFSSPLEPLLMAVDIGAFVEDSPWVSVYRREAPIPGRMVLFPSWLFHEVDVHRKTAPRVTVGFNLTLRLIGAVEDDELPSSAPF